MKHLRKFNESFDELEIIKDILIDLTDEGYNYTYPSGEDEEGISIVIYRGDGHYISFEEIIKECVLRIYQYMRELGWYSNMELVTRGYDGLINKKFIIRPDEGFRMYKDGSPIDNSWPRFKAISLKFNKKVTDEVFKEI